MRWVKRLLSWRKRKPKGRWVTREYFDQHICHWDSSGRDEKCKAMSVFHPSDTARFYVGGRTYKEVADELYREHGKVLK